jgi:hypothetical protein
MSDALDPESLAKQILVRHREAGYLRFSLPAALCTEPAAAALERGLRRQPGVYRVTVYRGWGKLSVFFDRYTCDAHDVALRLHELLREFARHGFGGGGPRAATGLLRAANPVPWLKAKTDQLKGKVEEWRFKARLLSQIATSHTQSHPLLQNVFTERAIINFLNDVVVFYLIKVHWELITQKWLKQPLRYRYAWLTVFYLVFLLVRFRKQGARK